MRPSRAIRTFIAGAIAIAAGTPALATTISSNMSVTASITANCTASSTAVAFGTLSTLTATPDDATGTFTVTCTNGAAWSATAGLGTGTGATFAVRKMVSGANLINYSLYTDSARTTVWGDGVAPTGKFTGTGTGSAQSTTFYGRVPGSQGTAPTGSYADTVAVTITF
jgi:spore coat protein U-like protein